MGLVCLFVNNALNNYVTNFPKKNHIGAYFNNEILIKILISLTFALSLNDCVDCTVFLQKKIVVVFYLFNMTPI